jgi:hypothetical protein
MGVALVLAAAAADVTPALAQPSRQMGALTIDERFALIAARVPEFGGLYVDEDAGALVVNVTGRPPGIIAALRHAIRDVFPDEDLPRRIRLREVGFEWSRMMRWRESATAVFGIQGVVATDIDEVANRLVIGVVDEALRAGIETTLGAAGVPPEGWDVKRMEVPVPSSSLLSVVEGDPHLHRPLVGGLEIPRSFPSGGFDVVGCTLGFVATRRGVPGVVTNSHCTNVQGGVEDTTYTQGAQFIGTETVDPPWRLRDPFLPEILSCPFLCNFGVSDPELPRCRCRFSDAAFVALGVAPGGEPVPPGFGNFSAAMSIAHAAEGAPDWPPTIPTSFPITSEGTAVVGQTVRKVGRTTGQTVGQVTATCVDVGQAGTAFLAKCQTLASYATDLGDSGSPVFSIAAFSPLLRPRARLLGINWGGGASGGVFSPIANIQRIDELGSLFNCTTGDC